MISLQAKNIATYLNTLPAVTSVADVYAVPPKAEVNWNYLYPFIVSDTVNQYWSKGIISREALLNITVVCKKQLWVWEYEEWELHDVLSVINNSLIASNLEWQPIMDWINIMSIQLGSLQQIAYINKRAIIVQSYFIKYKI